MKAIIIPSILAATVLVAGMFALMPVEKASTVHTTITATMMTLQLDSFDASTLAIADGDIITVNSDASFCLSSLLIFFDNLDADDGLDTITVEVDGITFTDDAGTALVVPILTDNAGFTGVQERVVDVIASLNDLLDGDTELCTIADDILFELDDGADVDGDLIAGEVTEIRAYAHVDGDVPITVLLV